MVNREANVAANRRLAERIDGTLGPQEATGLRARVKELAVALESVRGRLINVESMLSGSVPMTDNQYPMKAGLQALESVDSSVVSCEALVEEIREAISRLEGGL
jgi:uncharacterized protein (DUF2342 family)